MPGVTVILFNQTTMVTYGRFLYLSFLVAMVIFLAGKLKELPPKSAVVVAERMIAGTSNAPCESVARRKHGRETQEFSFCHESFMSLFSSRPIPSREEIEYLLSQFHVSVTHERWIADRRGKEIRRYTIPPDASPITSLGSIGYQLEYVKGNLRRIRPIYDDAEQAGDGYLER